MAAVAGSKGRLEIRQEQLPGVQMRVVEALLDNSLSASVAADVLLTHAALREVGIDTNMICNLACRYCYLEDRPSGKGTIPVGALEATLQNLAEDDVKLFAFIGKEPLSDSRAVRLLTSLNTVRSDGRQFRTGMVTNGTLVHRWLDKLIDANLSYLDVSIDGLGPVENELRGADVAEKIMSGVKLAVNSALQDRFATATVLTHKSLQGYPVFVEEMFGIGVKTCFSSPVLRFAMSNDVADFAVSLEETWKLAEQLASRHPFSIDRQIIIDLPYRYTWNLLKSGRISPSDVKEDNNEALYSNLQGSCVYIKLNPFPYSYWRALRITHDGKVILNMDLAAHVQYGTNAPSFDAVRANVFENSVLAGQAVLKDFISRHMDEANVDSEFERNLAGQFERYQSLMAA